MSRPLVVAAGNPERGDDGAGPAVLALLRDPPLAAELFAPRVVPPDLYARWSPERAVILVDAVRSGAAPGTVHRLDARARPLPAELCGLSSHGLGLAQAVELARALGALPARLTVYGIEAGACALGTAPCPEVRAAAAEVAAAIRAELGGPCTTAP